MPRIRMEDMRRKDVERISASNALDFTYTEFLAATFDRKTCLTEAVCREAFTTLDKNGDGTVDLGELHSGRLLGHIDMAELKETLEDLDENGDSVLDFPEYMEMLRSIDSKVVKTPKVVGETPDFGI
ncbi:unnamed protein product [Effrenium voratum]|nr:unnamed protein product [Effrenium voratum]